MHKKLEINWTKIKGGCESGRKTVPYDSESDLPLVKTRFQGKKDKMFIEKEIENLSN